MTAVAIASGIPFGDLLEHPGLCEAAMAVLDKSNAPQVDPSGLAARMAGG